MPSPFFCPSTHMVSTQPWEPFIKAVITAFVRDSHSSETHLKGRSINHLMDTIKWQHCRWTNQNQRAYIRLTQQNTKVRSVQLPLLRWFIPTLTSISTVSLKLLKLNASFCVSICIDGDAPSLLCPERQSDTPRENSPCTDKKRHRQRKGAMTQPSA